MSLEDSVREDIAFIRRAVEQGRGYAAGRSLDMLVWGVAVAIGYLATYATAIRWWRVDPNWIWAVCIVSQARICAALPGCAGCRSVGGSPPCCSMRCASASRFCLSPLC
jgi:hypothetical protein